MIRSMTGFGRARFAVGDIAFDIEVRSVNHRHLEARVRLPRPLAAFEAAAREAIKERLARGKVDVSVTPSAGSAALQRVEIDVETARQYARVAAELSESEGLAGPLSVGALLALPGVSSFAERDLSSAELESEFVSGVRAAIEELDAMRVSEGTALERDLGARVAAVGDILAALEERAGVVAEAARARLRKRAEQLEQETGILDEGRLHQEIVIAADRMDITEEIVRLRSHMDQFAEIVALGGPGAPVGRRLDFLMQEFAREANTIGAKSNDSPVAHRVVELKTEIERIREQVQNIE